LSAASYVPTTFAAEKARRVGLIGAGWVTARSDLWRLVQVAPIEIVSICDPDKHMLAEAVEIASQRQKSGSNRALTTITARCSRRRISTYVLVGLLIIGTRCTGLPRWNRARMSIARTHQPGRPRGRGHARRGAAQTQRVVQIGTQRQKHACISSTRRRNR